MKSILPETNYEKIMCVFTFLIVVTGYMGLASASDLIINMPEDITYFEDWKIQVLQANADEGFFSTATSNYWGFCQQECWNLVFQGDCNPCDVGEVASYRTWHPDSMSVMDTWTSANSYCNDWLRPYSYYNQQAFCMVPTTECSGGADPGDRKCIGDQIWQCDNSGAWDYTSSCDFGCSGGSCADEQCIDNVNRQCSGDSVYWYDSCGEKQSEYERCESDEECQGDRCVRVCEVGLIGEALCKGSIIVQQNQEEDCTTEIIEIESCQHGCENSQCKDPKCPVCLEPTAWSQCDGKKMTRTNYECGADTNYECNLITETEACECGTSGQCSYDETCEDSICTPLVCGEDAIADNHECIEKSSIQIWMIVAIAIIFVILLIVAVLVYVKMKGGRNKKLR